MRRTASPPIIHPEAMAVLREIAGFRKCTVAEAIELSARIAIDAMEGRPISPDLLRY